MPVELLSNTTLKIQLNITYQSVRVITGLHHCFEWNNGSNPTRFAHEITGIIGNYNTHFM